VARAAACATAGGGGEWWDLPYGAEHYLKTKELLPDNAIQELRKYKAIYLGALGDPRLETGLVEGGILLKLRFALDQYVNLRPIQLMEGVWTPLKDKGPKEIDFYVVRENTEDFYIGMGNRAKKGRTRQVMEVVKSHYKATFNLDLETDADEIAYQIGVVSRKGAERVMRYAFDLAKKKGRKKVTAIDKANVLTKVYGLWREVFAQVARDYPGIETDMNFVDACTMWMVKNPEWYQVLVTPNMFGDIITDLGAMVQGGMGVAPGGNINPRGTSMFEPIHGSAPKYKGMNRANPIATILAGSMMLETLGEPRAAQRVEQAVREVLKAGKVRTPDLGGTSTCSQVGDAVAKAARELP
ncbi:MAG: 3-isopropylmalate dehydrogenase, partial [Euryarchaeota archaeon]|nr:3-isopropylmalate dehydrogenase [Euryarchaeota archaeon]